MSDKVDTRSRARASSTSSVSIDTKSKTGKYSGKSGVQEITQFLSNRDDNKSDTDPLNPPNGTNDRDTPPNKNKGNKKRVVIKTKKMLPPRLNLNHLKRIARPLHTLL